MLIPSSTFCIEFQRTGLGLADSLPYGAGVVRVVELYAPYCPALLAGRPALGGWADFLHRKFAHTLLKQLYVRFNQEEYQRALNRICTIDCNAPNKSAITTSSFKSKKSLSYFILYLAPFSIFTATQTH